MFVMIGGSGGGGGGSGYGGGGGYQGGGGGGVCFYHTSLNAGTSPILSPRVHGTLYE